MKGLKIIVGSLAIIGVSIASADVPLPFGWYLEGNIGTSHISEFSNPSGTSLSSSNAAANINVGYKFIPFFGLEIGYSNFGEANSTYNKTKVSKITTWIADIAGKAIFPFADSGFEIFGKLGASRIFSRTKISNEPYVNANGLFIPTGTNNATGLFMGLGGEYAFTPNLQGNVQWFVANGNSSTGNYNFYGVGFSYIFD